ncbi:hypothetical protein Acr_06g0016010 [Actinidia rufa]|uniref:Uncharacterized protein n=1 Tax=Actinidia rufa TaxID=165716 RepID=A0A7J0ET46_9ERIC|nr:hypothetical protein Acr_06g0016010 [Actinidia rufa]
MKIETTRLRVSQKNQHWLALNLGLGKETQFKVFGFEQRGTEAERKMDQCLPSKVLVVDDGEARCLVKERVEFPFEAIVATPYVNYGCGRNAYYWPFHLLDGVDFSKISVTKKCGLAFLGVEKNGILEARAFTEEQEAPVIKSLNSMRKNAGELGLKFLLR